jgi:hypothetical protein
MRASDDDVRVERNFMWEGETATDKPQTRYVTRGRPLGPSEPLLRPAFVSSTR